ncbi:Na+/H+ antiporter subunit A [Occultella aeris]|uniref:Na(+)/H(+) antiporter subunit A n=1 Tax=Occultella aeris TaxID=2761496 RepID=A0A7M4DER2_9MICO|nr:Na+/H+ antiporter subunit A [Occultella aeris]VZO35405.1 Na(+)/H(+) antiporter subunit A [Occultella aeris]
MLQLLALHLLAAVAAPAIMRRFGRKGFLPLALVPGSAAVWAVANTGAVLDGRGPTLDVAWIPALDMSLSFRLDVLSWLMVILVGGVGAIVLGYCAWYFASGAKLLGRFAGVFVAFAGAMLGLVTTDNTLVLYVFWELTTVFSYLLIGHYFDRKGARRAAMQAIIVTTLGGLAMLFGFLILGEAEGGSYVISELIADPPLDGSALVTAGIVMVLVGAISKSALVPFHFWLPGAMAAPTPVSAYLHAAAMVKAGVYLVARFAPGFAEVPVWQWMILLTGGATMILGGYRALRQHDLKLLLAFGTVSQLGFLILLVGQADRAIALAGLALIGAHAMFKAALFLTVGVIDAAAGTRDLRQLSGLAKHLPWATVPGVLATFSMVGLPPFAGYVGKEAALEALVHSDDPMTFALLVIVVIGSILTFAYGMRFLWGAFARKKGVEDTPVDKEAAGLYIAPNVLAFAGLIAGLFPVAGETLLAPYADTYPRGEPGHLTLWAGFGLPLLLTGVIIVGGVLLMLARRGVERVQEVASVGPDADRTYRGTMRRLDSMSVAVTSITQRGSLPVYLALILLTTVVMIWTSVYAGGLRIGAVKPWDYPVQAGVAIVIAVAAFLTARARRRLKAVVLLGITGYGVVLLFALHGAPDLALTQALVETITLVVFILVLRRLPAYYSNRPLKASRWWRAILAIMVGLTVTFVALVIPNARVTDSIAELFPEEAYNYGYGRNIVNVTLVDIRAWDTMGEISVLLVAATGVASLVFLRTRAGRVERIRDHDMDRGSVWASDSPGDDALVRQGRTIPVRSTRNRRWISAGVALAPHRRSVIFEVATRLIFHTMLVFAVYLLFAGHNSPGGGFVAGLVAGIALTVRYLAGGRYELGEAAPVLPGLLLGSGLFLSAGAGAVPLAFGGVVLQSVVIDIPLGYLGDVHLVTTLFFDIGVFLVVVGLMLDILRSLGAEVDRQGEAEGRAVPDVAHDSPRSTADDAQPLEDALAGGGAP